MPTEASLARYQRNYGTQKSPPKTAQDIAALNRQDRADLERLQADEVAREKASRTRFEPRIILATEHTAASPGFPMTMWSDWHWGEVVDHDETGGLNEFNHKIALERVDRLVNGTINLLRNYGGRAPSYPGIYVCLGGDILSGGIHDDLVETNWAPAVGQAFEAHAVIAGGILRMADEFGQVHVPCVVGNHGRNAKKPRAKLRIRENSEYYLYKALERHFANDPRIQFTVAEQTDILFEVYGHRFLLTHGDALGTKGGDGIIGAIGPIQRGAVKIGTAERHAKRGFDTVSYTHLTLPTICSV